MSRTGFGGIFPVLYSFFDSSGRLDRRGYAAQIEACLKHSAHGITVLGLATEVNKLTFDEKRQVLDWVTEDLNWKLPLAVTVAASCAEEASAFVRACEGAGASFVILQPPTGARPTESELLSYFGAIADRAQCLVGIQNAPAYLGIALSNRSLSELRRRHPNIAILKAEGSALSVRQTIEETGSEFEVFNGRGGLELPDNLRAGCVGLIPAPECIERQVRIYESWKSGREADADTSYAEILPLITFLMQSIDTFLCYGKRLLAQRLDLGPVFDREPAMAPTAFGLEALKRLSADLGPLL